MDLLIFDFQQSAFSRLKMLKYAAVWTKKIDYDKKVDNVQVALEGLENGMTIMLGGFGLCGIPENSIAELVKETTDLTCISNNAGLISVLAYYKRQIKKNDLPMLEKMLNLNAKCFLENLMWN
jgi:hypothetical protein